MKELELIKILWDYMQIDSKLQKADCIIVLGCKNIELVDVAVDLFNKNVPVSGIAATLMRTETGIRARLKKMGLIDNRGDAR